MRDNEDWIYHVLFLFFFSDASVQCDSGTFPSRLLPPGSEQAQRRANSSPVREPVIGLRPQVHLWGGATRKSRWVNFLLVLNLPECPICCPRCFSFSLAFICLLKPRSLIEQKKKPAIFSYYRDLKSFKVKMFFHGRTCCCVVDLKLRTV